MARPALQRLLIDVQARRVDIIVVYKVDRLTRSLADFAKIVEILDAHDTPFVSVTQPFNTTTSMGRLTLNVLLSFAQFEREVTGERIRDKIAASKQRGMWMGGYVPLGYDLKDRSLEVNPAEAERVRTLFALYNRLKSADAVLAKAKELGLVSKQRIDKAGRRTGGNNFTRGALYAILANPLYVGEIPHKGKRYPGRHKGIVDQDVFETTQKILAENRRKKHGHCAVAEHVSLLAGLVRNTKGTKLTATHTTKNGRRYRYYVAKDGASPNGLRLPARDLEVLVVNSLTAWLSDKNIFTRAVHGLAGSQNLGAWIGHAAFLADGLRQSRGASLRDLLTAMVDSVIVETETVVVKIDLSALNPGRSQTPDEKHGTRDFDFYHLTVPARLLRKRGSLCLHLHADGVVHPTNIDPILIRLIAQGRAWFQQLLKGDRRSLREIARHEGVNESYVGHLLDLAFLSPEVVAKIVEGRQPAWLTGTRLKLMCPLPLDWDQQRDLMERPTCPTTI